MSELRSHADSAAEHLSHLPRGRQPYPVFRQDCRRLTTPTIEVVILQRRVRNLAALLIQRPPEDEFWPEEWHIPGSVPVGDDVVEHFSDYRAPLSRIFDDDLGGSLRVIGEPVEIGTQRRISPRGHELAVIHFAEALGEPSAGQFFDVLELAQNPPAPRIVDGHLESIQKAANIFLADQGVR